MICEGLVTSVESGRATLQMMDRLGKAIGKIIAVIGTGLLLKKTKETCGHEVKTENLLMPEVGGEGVTSQTLPQKKWRWRARTSLSPKLKSSGR